MKTVKQALTDARALISDIEHWTQEADAMDNTGVEVGANDDTAYCWCADGALGVAAVRKKTTLYVECSEALDAAVRRLHPELVASSPETTYLYVYLNDGELAVGMDYDVCHREIIRVFDDAIEHAAA